MDRKVCISLAVLALVLAGPDTTRAAAFAGGTDSLDVAVAARQLMPMPSSWSSMRLEDGAAVDLEHKVHRRVLAGPGLGSPVYGNNQFCPKTGCTARGQPYTDRGCGMVYGCRTKPQ